MSGYKNPKRGEIVAAVPLMVRGVTKEHTTGRARCELMRSSGSKVRVASAPEDTKVGVSGRGTEESLVRSRSGRSDGRKAVEKVGGGVKTLCLEARGKGGLDQKSAHDIICSPNHALCLAVLWRSIRTRHTELDTAGEEEGARGGVIELTPVVALDDLNGEAELSGHPGKEVKKGGEGVRLSMQREGPGVVREIINDHQIILITRNAEYRRSPHITVDKIKNMRSMRRRRKRKANMTTKLACLTEVLSSSPSTRDISTTTNLSQNISTRMTEAAVPSGGRRCHVKSS
jgi:hypothetical protein